MSRYRILTSTLVFAVAVAVPASAQEIPISPESTGPELVDRTVAVVGDSVILMTQIQEEVLRMQAQGMTLPTEPGERERFQRDILERLINVQVILQAALRDTLVSVEDARVAEVVEQDIQSRIRSFGGESAFREALAGQGMTLAGYRDYLEEQARKEQLQQQFLARRAQGLQGVQVDEAEVREVYESQRANLTERPASVTFRQVVIRPEASDSVRRAAREEAERILEMIRSGEGEFEELARRFSDDPGSRTQGGDLGWFRRGRMVSAFEDAAFGLREGEVSEVVETDFGFHIIKVERIRGPERRARHILVRPEAGSGDVEQARVEAWEVRSAVEAGASIDELYEAHAFPDAPPDSVTVAMNRLESLPGDYGQALRTAEPGDILGPIEFRLSDGDGAQPLFGVVRVEAIRTEGEYSFEDVRGQIRSQLREQKILERILEDLRTRTYIDIRL